MIDLLDRSPQEQSGFSAGTTSGQAAGTRPSWDVERSPYPVSASDGGFAHQQRPQSGPSGNTGASAASFGASSGPRTDFAPSLKRSAMAMEDPQTGHQHHRRRRESITSTGTYEDEASQEHRRESSAAASRGNGHGSASDRQPKRGARACTNCASALDSGTVWAHSWHCSPRQADGARIDAKATSLAADALSTASTVSLRSQSPRSRMIRAALQAQVMLRGAWPDGPHTDVR